MSFSSEQKKRIIAEQYKSACCRRAFILGALSARGFAVGADISLRLEKKEFCEFCSKLIYEFYGSESSILSSSQGGRYKMLSFRSKAASRYIASIETQGALFTKKCQNCSAAYLRGVFLACGTLSDPKKQYLLELSADHNSDRLIALIREHSFSPKLTVRKGRQVIYFKKASEIEDFCGFLGLTDAMFEITNTQIEREFLNNANRVVNCETNNIEKSVSASGKQIEAISALIEHNLLSSLPEELEYTARLRIQNDALSLSQLSKLFTPPISKSGLSHRLSKIIEIANQLLSGKS